MHMALRFSYTRNFIIFEKCFLRTNLKNFSKILRKFSLRLFHTQDEDCKHLKIAAHDFTIPHNVTVIENICTDQLNKKYFNYSKAFQIKRNIIYV